MDRTKGLSVSELSDEELDSAVNNITTRLLRLRIQPFLNEVREGQRSIGEFLNYLEDMIR